MPCYDARDHDPSWDIREAREKSDRLESGLCAVFTELEKRNILTEVIAASTNDGEPGIDLWDFWYKHQQEDEARLKKEWEKLSVHEQNIMKQMIRENKI
jgi:hypothetical protein